MVFGVADYESELKIQKFELADQKWGTKILKLLDWDDIWYLGVLELLITTRAQNSEIQNGGSNMADQNTESYLIGMKFGTQGILGSLITYLNSTFTNLKWRIQYG